MSTSKPSARRIALLLALLTSLGPFSIDAYLPAFHAIGEGLRATPVEVQQTLTAYMIPFAFMALWHGAISDAIGRRKMILAGLGAFAIASLGAAFATRIELLWFWRAVQGVFAGATIVISRAVVRDLFEGAQAQRLMARMTMIFAVAPVIAPLIGGYLQVLLGWRAVFFFLVLMSGVLFAACWFLLPETLAKEKRQPLAFDYLSKTYVKVLSSPKFLFACAAFTFNFIAFFIYVMSAPAFLMTLLKLPETAFFWLFGPAMSGLMAGSWVSSKMAGKASLKKTVRLAYYIMTFSALANLALSFLLPEIKEGLTFPPPISWSETCLILLQTFLAVLPIGLFTFGMSIATPSLTLLALDEFPEQRGLAASCQIFLQMSANAAIAGVLAPLLWSAKWKLASGMMFLMLMGLACTFIYGKVAKASRAEKII